MEIFDENLLALLKIFSDQQVRYILVGGLATNYHGYSRATGDVDLWLDDSESNRIRLVNSLKKFDIEGAEIFLKQPLVAGFTEILLDKGIYIDLMSDMKFFKQENFDDCFDLAESFKIENKLEIKVLHINHLIQEKEKSERPKDAEDVIQLKKILELKRKH